MKMGLWFRAGGMASVAIAGALFALWRMRRVPEGFEVRKELRFDVEVRNENKEWFSNVEVPIPMPLARGPWHEALSADVSEPGYFREDIIGNREYVARFSDFEAGALKTVAVRVELALALENPVPRFDEDWLRFAPRNSVAADGKEDPRSSGYVVRWVNGLLLEKGKLPVSGASFATRLERQDGDTWVPAGPFAEPGAVEEPKPPVAFLPFLVMVDGKELEKGLARFEGAEGFRFRYVHFELR